MEETLCFSSNQYWRQPLPQLSNSEIDDHNGNLHLHGRREETERLSDVTVTAADAVDHADDDADEMSLRNAGNIIKGVGESISASQIACSEAENDSLQGDMTDCEISSSYLFMYTLFYVFYICLKFFHVDIFRMFCILYFSRFSLIY